MGFEEKGEEGGAGGRGFVTLTPADVTVLHFGSTWHPPPAPVSPAAIWIMLLSSLIALPWSPKWPLPILPCPYNCTSRSPPRSLYNMEHVTPLLTASAVWPSDLEWQTPASSPDRAAPHAVPPPCMGARPAAVLKHPMLLIDTLGLPHLLISPGTLTDHGSDPPTIIFTSLFNEIFYLYFLRVHIRMSVL